MEDIFKVSSSAADSEFCEWAHVEIDLYIPHCKYQVKSYLTPCFSAACAAVIAHKNHFFTWCQQNKSCESTVKFSLNNCERVFKAVKFAYDNKTRVYHFPWGT